MAGNGEERLEPLGEQGWQFLKGAKRYIEEVNYGFGAFMLHQATESCLIGIIWVLSGYQISSYNLSRILRFTLLFTGEIADVLELEKTEQAKLLEHTCFWIFGRVVA